VCAQREPASAPRPQSANSFLRAHSRTGYVPQSARPASVEPPHDKLTVPKAAATARDVRQHYAAILPPCSRQTSTSDGKLVRKTDRQVS